MKTIQTNYKSVYLCAIFDSEPNVSKMNKNKTNKPKKKKRNKDTFKWKIKQKVSKREIVECNMVKDMCEFAYADDVEFIHVFFVL